jgi:hypothetical protein
LTRKTEKSTQSGSTGKSVTPSAAEARRLIAIIEKSQVPFGESAPIFARLKAQIDAGRDLNIEDYEHLLGLVKKAKDWDRAVQSSAMTQPEETLSG